MARKHWLTEIGDEVRQRAMDMVDSVAASLKDTVPYGQPPPKPPELTLQMYLQAPPEMRQAYLQGLPEDQFAKTISHLQSEAVDRFGAMAANLQPIFDVDTAHRELAALPMQNDPNLGVAAAHAELTQLLGMDPFAP